MDASKEFLEYVIKALVDYPDDVRIESSMDEMGILLRLTCRKTDMGKVIGKEGAIAKSLRCILRAVGMREGARVNLKIEDLPAQAGPQAESYSMNDIKKDLETV